MKLKHIIATISLLTSCLQTLGQEVVLRNLQAFHSLQANTYSGTNIWGFWTGHNYLYRESFAEKYNINGRAEVVGVRVHLTGAVADLNRTASFTVHNVQTSGSRRSLPLAELGKKDVRYANLNLDRSETEVRFDAPIQVADSFFVALTFEDYAHGCCDGDRIALMHGPAGSRSNADARRFGRNAVRRHNHANPADWYDFATQNFTNINTHFAIYPIVVFQTPQSISTTNDSDLIEVITLTNQRGLRISAQEPLNEARLSLYSLEGRKIQDLKLTSGEQLEVSLPTKGLYFLKGNVGASGYFKKIVIP